MFDAFNLFGQKKNHHNSSEKTPSKKSAQKNNVSNNNAPQETPQINGPELEHLMTEIARTPEKLRPQYIKAFYQTILKSIILTPIPSGHSPDDIFEGGISLMITENKQGLKGIPVFTSEHAMSLWVTEPTEYIGIPFSMLCSQVIEMGLDFMSINPAGPSGGELAHHELSYLADGMIPPLDNASCGEIVLEKDTEIYLAPMSDMSEMLSERLSGVFRQKGALVNRAYAFQVAFSQGPMKNALGIRMPEGTEESWEIELWPDVLAVLQETLGSKEYVNVFLLNSAGDLEDTLQEITEPLYVAKAS